MTEDLRRQIVALLPRLRRFAHALTGSSADADDVVQGACERALTRLYQYEPGTRLDSWMFRIVHTVAIDRGRKMKVRRALPIDDTVEAQGFDARTHERTEARLALSVVRAEMERLPEEQRVLIAMVAIDGMTYQEAASTLDIPIGTVMSRLSRARRRLAEAIERDSGTGSRAEARP